MKIHTFHQRSTHHFTSLDYTSFPIFNSLHFRMFRHHPSRTFQFPSLVVTFPSLFLRMCDVQRKVSCASAGSWFHSLIVLFTKEYLSISVWYPTIRDGVVVSSIRNVCTLSHVIEPSTLEDETAALS